MGLFDTLTATAVSFVVGGNTGISPFLSLFLVGIIERCNPNLLQMSGITEMLLASWPGMILLGIASVLEFVSMCVPVLDEIIDTIMTFVIPIMSVLGSLSTFGLFTMPSMESVEVNNDGGGERELISVGSSGLLILLQCFIVVIGIGLALSMHMVKMLVRFVGQGWLTYCLSVLEATWCITTIVLAIFIRPIAVFIAVCICLAGAYNIKRRISTQHHDPIPGHASPIHGNDTRKDEEKGDYQPPVVATK